MEFLSKYKKNKRIMNPCARFSSSGSIISVYGVLVGNDSNGYAQGQIFVRIKKKKV